MCHVGVPGIPETCMFKSLTNACVTWPVPHPSIFEAVLKTCSWKCEAWWLHGSIAFGVHLRSRLANVSNTQTN